MLTDVAGQPDIAGSDQTLGEIPGNPQNGSNADGSRLAGSAPNSSGGGTAPSEGAAVGPGVTRDAVAITVSAPFSGAYGAFFDKIYNNGLVTWADEVNAKGGIHGRRVTFKKVDNLGTSEGGIAACKEAKSNGTLFSFLLNGDDPETDCLDQAGTPQLVQDTNRDPAPWRFSRAMQSVPSVGGALASFTKSVLEGGGKKIGLIVVNHPTFLAVDGPFISKGKALGLNIVSRQVVAQNQGTFVGELSRLRSDGAQLVAVLGATEILGILRDARAIGYQPAWTGFGWGVDEVSAAGRGVIEGIKVLRQFGTADLPAFQRYRDIAAKQGKQAVTTTDGSGYAAGLLIGAILERAGGGLTRESIVAAIDAIQFDPGLRPPVDWQPPDRIGSRARYPAVCCAPDGTWKSLGPPRGEF